MTALNTGADAQPCRWLRDGKRWFVSFDILIILKDSALIVIRTGFPDPLSQYQALQIEKPNYHKMPW